MGENWRWLLEDDEKRLVCMVGLARARQAGGCVLICPRSASRPALRSALAGIGSVYWSEVDRPTPAQLEQLSQGLLGWGRPLVLVEGPSAVELPDAEEGSNAVIEELVEGFSNDIDLLVLLTPGESDGNQPTRALTPEELEELGFRETEDG